MFIGTKEKDLLTSVAKMVRNRNGDEVEVPPKDEEEKILEKLVFGDSEGFETNLRKLDNLYDYSSDEQEDEANVFDQAEGNDENSSDEALEEVQDEDLFFFDTQGDSKKNENDMEVDESSAEGNDSSSDSEVDEEQADAWEDSDEERLNISLVNSDKLKKLRKDVTDTTINGRSYIRRLRSQFEKIYPRPKWVEDYENEVNSSSEDSAYETTDNEDDEQRKGNTNAVLEILSKSPQFLISKQMKLISPNKISISRLKDANHAKRSKSAIQCLSFHLTHSLLLTGGFDRTLRIYHIDGKNNNFLTSLHLRNTPISSCYFSPLNSDKNQNLVFAAGRRRYMNKWNLTSGSVEKISRMYGHEKYQRSMEHFKISPKGTYIGMTGGSGWCNLLNGSSGQWVNGFKIDGTIVDIEFSYDESFIVAINSAGEIWEFALSEKTADGKTQNEVIRRWNDDSGIGITKIRLGGPKSRWLAVGTNNGVVNVYDRSNFTPDKNPKPIKSVENLVTTISTLQFSSDGQILCIASRAKRDSLRLVHIPTCSVYSNWPTSGTPLGRVTAVAFSPNNEVLAIGNEGGKVTLWRLNHY